MIRYPTTKEVVNADQSPIEFKWNSLCVEQSVQNRYLFYRDSNKDRDIFLLHTL